MARVFSVATFNVLAPCYKRLDVTSGVSGDLSSTSSVYSEADKKVLGMGVGRRKPRPRESQFCELWKTRCREMCVFLTSAENSFDVIALQEYWFHDEYDAIVKSFFAQDYFFVTLQRTGEKRDGLVTLVRKSKLDVINVEKLCFHEPGNRVALLTCLRFKDLPDRNVVLLNTHLTFPHSSYDKMLRQNQIMKITEFVDGYVDQHGLELSPVLITGDFNGGVADPVSAHLRANCYVNTFVHLTDIDHVETHLNHRNEKVFVDHIWCRPNIYGSVDRQRRTDELVLVPTSSVVMPSCRRSVQRWPEDFTVSDHRLLSVTFGIEISEEGNTTEDSVGEDGDMISVATMPRWEQALG